MDMAKMSLLPVLLVLVACEKQVQMWSVYCAEINRGETDEALREAHFVALDSMFEELRFEHDDHLGSRCVKSFWGRDSKATINVCTDLTIITSYGRDNVGNEKLDQLLGREVNRLFGADFAVNECPIPYGFTMTGWPEVDSDI